jgi:hypothetical protein
MNKLSTVLVHADRSPRFPQRLALARAIAQSQEASVEALYAAQSAFFEMPFALSEGTPMGDLALQMDAERLAQAKALFDRSMAAPGCPVAWSDMSREPVGWGFVQRAFCADLVVAGQKEVEAAHARDLPSDFLEHLLLASGKPVLVVPTVGVEIGVPDRILLAWSNRRESAAALDAAWPLLQRASHVDVVHWQDDGAPDCADARVRLARHLDRKGVSATLHWYGSGVADVGDHLLSLACDLGSDLLVMGCYGHARTRELLLGGATRTVLRSMTLPVLLAH